MVSEKDWRLIDKGVENIRKKYGFKEFHMNRLFNRNKISIKINKNCIPSIVINSIYDLISNCSATLFCMSINKPNRFSIDSQADIEFEVWESLINRLNICVDKSSKKSLCDEFGLLIMDEKNPCKDLRIRNYLYKLRHLGTKYQIINRIIEDPVFSPSDWRNLIQLADAVTSCVKFHVYNESFFNSQFEKIKGKFDKDKHGNIYNAGLRIW